MGAYPRPPLGEVDGWTGVGLWVPESSAATWVICASPNGEFEPMYVEPEIRVSPFALNATGSYTAGGGESQADSETGKPVQDPSRSRATSPRRSTTASSTASYF